ncbi:MAG: ThiF family adenylyltransferase [Gulosibacter sp.]|uniref:ThiF family adenylyltransferase n=1 Tax=Gulosibacter sp. TaxID=2817531 RepID=UPI003F902436
MTFETHSPMAAHLERQARHVRLLGYGQPGVHRASQAHIVVVGAGGLGCPALQVLAAAGVGRLSIIDDDIVERSNLARQTLFREADIGRPKATVAVEVLKSLGPETWLEPRRVHLDESNALELIAEADVVVDTTDHWPTRFAVADACWSAGIPLVWGSVLGWDGLLTVFVPGGANPSIDDLVNREQQLSVDGPDCATAGVFAPLVAEIGASMAGEALRLVTGAGSALVGTVRSTNGRTGRVRELPLVSGMQAAAGSDADLASETVVDNVDTRPEKSEILPEELIVDVRPATHPDLHLTHPYLHLPLETIAEHVTHGRVDLLPLDGPLVVVCAQGPRARYAAELLEDAGAEAVRTIPAGIFALSNAMTGSAVPTEATNARPADATTKEPS